MTQTLRRGECVLIAESYWHSTEPVTDAGPCTCNGCKCPPPLTNFDSAPVCRVPKENHPGRPSLKNCKLVARMILRSPARHATGDADEVCTNLSGDLVQPMSTSITCLSVVQRVRRSTNRRGGNPDNLHDLRKEKNRRIHKLHRMLLNSYRRPPSFTPRHSGAVVVIAADQKAQHKSQRSHLGLLQREHQTPPVNCSIGATIFTCSEITLLRDAYAPPSTAWTLEDLQSAVSLPRHNRSIV